MMSRSSSSHRKDRHERNTCVQSASKAVAGGVEHDTDRAPSAPPPPCPFGLASFIHSFIHICLHFPSRKPAPSLHPSLTSWTLFLYSKAKFKGRTEGKKSKKRAEKKWPEELDERRESRGHAVRRAIEREVAARHVQPQSQGKSGVQCPLQRTVRMWLVRAVSRMGGWEPQGRVCRRH